MRGRTYWQEGKKAPQYDQPIRQSWFNKMSLTLPLWDNVLSAERMWMQRGWRRWRVLTADGIFITENHEVYDGERAKASCTAHHPNEASYTRGLWLVAGYQLCAGSLLAHHSFSTKKGILNYRIIYLRQHGDHTKIVTTFGLWVICYLCNWDPRRDRPATVLFPCQAVSHHGGIRDEMGGERKGRARMSPGSGQIFGL